MENCSWKLNCVGENGLQGEIGSKGITGLYGRRGPPGDNIHCIIGEKSTKLIGMQVNNEHGYNNLL